ncbi:MAG TPA: BamA/TamA family outer membrane protein [Candidatus Udaeobacter sp.]|nr:BamA/TamA family outer membrane protein [Candidatus Udaeobacter sp.]
MSRAWRLAIALLLAATVSRAQDPGLPAGYGDFLDSLRTRSDTLDREGAQPSWPAADSAAGLLITHGPAYVDSLPHHEHSPLDFDFGPGLLAYNRVEGLRLGGEAKVSAGPFSLSGAVGYGISSEEWRHKERAEWQTERYGRFGVEHADLLERFGAGPVPVNSLNALVAGADDQDYLQRRRTGVDWRLGGDRRWFSAGYMVADERSAEAETDWNLFSRDKGPRPNPAIDEGRARRLDLTASTNLVARQLRGARLRMGAEAEIAGYGLGGDFDYDRYRLTLDSRWPVLWRDNLDLRAEIGAARNRPTIQSRFYLGGPAAMRAYGVNELAGDRYVFTSFDYLVGTDLLARAHLGFAELQFIPFFELGAAWFDENGRGLWSSPDSHDWKSDAGLGIQRLFLFDALLRFDFCWRLDRGSDRFLYRFGFRTPLFGLSD